MIIIILKNKNIYIHLTIYILLIIQKVIKISKKQASVSIDVYIWEESQRLFPKQISNKIETFLRNLVSYEKGDLKNVDRKILNNKIDEKEKELSRLSSELINMKDQVIHLDKQAKDKENEELEAQKEEMDNYIECEICKIKKIPDRMSKIKGADVCTTCFQTTESKTLMQYIKRAKEDPDYKPEETHQGVGGEEQ